MEFNLEYLKTITILYVEDEEEVRGPTSKAFEKLFKKVYIAKDGEEGFLTFNKYKNEIEIIVSDINMPNKSGLELIAEILVIQQLPVILTTAHTDEEYLMRAIDLDVDKYMTKPIKIKKLILAISQLVEKYRKKEHLKRATASLITKSKEINEEKKQLSTKAESITQELELLRKLSDKYINIIRTDKKGIITDVSEQFCQKFNYLKRELIGKSINTIQDGNKIQKYMLDIIHEKKVMTVFHTFHTHNGTKVECDMMINPSYGDNRYIIGYQFYLDIL